MNSLRPPFSYPGGKRDNEVQRLVWSSLGVDVPTYIEPFCGSAAMLLGRPGGAGKYEVVGDENGLVANVWRSIKLAPEKVAEHCNWPPCEIDLAVRAKFLRNWKETEACLLSSPSYCDPLMAAWWIWCQSVSFSPDWLTQKSPPIAKPYRRGILSPGTQIPELLSALAERLHRVTIGHGSWTKLVTPSALGFYNTGTTPTGIFFDPPYPEEELDCGSDPDVARDVEKWCRENGDDERLRIVLCGHVGDYSLDGWRVENWGGSRGWGRARRGTNEAIWISPHCISTETSQRSLFEQGNP